MHARLPRPPLVAGARAERRAASHDCTAPCLSPGNAPTGSSQRAGRVPAPTHACGRCAGPRWHRRRASSRPSRPMPTTPARTETFGGGGRARARHPHFSEYVARSAACLGGGSAKCVSMPHAPPHVCGHRAMRIASRRVASIQHARYDRRLAAHMRGSGNAPALGDATRRATRTAHAPAPPPLARPRVRAMVRARASFRTSRDPLYNAHVHKRMRAHLRRAHW